MKIAIIDDQIEFLNYANNLFKQYINPSNTVIDLFVNYEDFLHSVGSYDYIFLDIEMPSCNGIRLASQIKKMNNKIEIIFLSNLDSLVYDSFVVRPFDFIPKKFIEERMEGIFQRLNKDFEQKNKSIEAKWYSNTVSILEKNILKIEKDKFICKVTTIDGKSELIINNPLKEMMHNLSDNFIIINKSQIVNMEHVQSIIEDALYLKNNEICYISRRKLKNTVNIYFNYLQENM